MAGGDNDIVEEALVEPEETKAKAKKHKDLDEKKNPKMVRLTKIALLVINGITFSTGFILLVTGCVYYSNHESYRGMWNIGSSFCSASVFCIVIGLTICLVSVLGFVGALKSNYCCLLAFSVLMSITIFLV